MAKYLKLNWFRNPVSSLFILALIFTPKLASAAFLSSALADKKAQAVIVVMGSVGVGMLVASLAQEFFAGSNSNWLVKSLGIVAGVILVVNPSLLGTTMASFGL